MTIEASVKLEGLLKEEDFCEEIGHAKGDEEILGILQNHGVEMTAGELAQFKTDGHKLLADEGYISEDGELTEKALEYVSGGKFRFGRFILGVGIGGVSAYFGCAPGIAFGAFLIISSFM